MNVQSTLTFFFSFSGVDVLRATDLTEQSVGITITQGRCAHDTAYKLNERAILTVQTSQIFPQLEEFPFDFSILAEIRIDQGLCSLNTYSKF